jgi:hypothetical protein
VPRPQEPQPETPVETLKPEEPRSGATLQTKPPNVEEAVRATMQRATNDLNRVDYRSLNADGRTQYDLAKSLLRQASDAIAKKNLVFAKSLADKAATLAAQLGPK